MPAEAKAPPVIPTKVDRRLRWGAVLGLVAALVIGLVIFLNEPKGQFFYPRCPLYEATGLACAGCGAMRALHQVSHGNFSAAFHFNPLLMLMLPVAGWFGVRWCAREFWRRELPPCEVTSAWVWIIGGLVLAFSILRNLPWTSFRWLGP